MDTNLTSLPWVCRWREILRGIGLLLLACAVGTGRAISGETSSPYQEVTPCSSAAGNSATALREALDAEWEWRAAQFPEDATEENDHRYDDRLTDRSIAAVARRREHHRQFRAAIGCIRREALEGEERISWDIFSYLADLAVREDALLVSMAPRHQPSPWSADDSPFPVTQREGPQFELPLLVQSTRFQTAEDYRRYLARLRAIPTSLDQLREQLEAGRVARVTPPRASLSKLPGQFAALLEPDLQRNPLYAPFLSFSEAVGEEPRAGLAQEAEQVLHTRVIPAVARFRDYLAQVWIPHARQTLGVSALPHGQEYYALAIERSTTLRKTPGELRDLGLREVARIDQAMQDVMKQVGFTGTPTEFRAFLRSDKRFQFTSPDEELMAVRDMAKRVDAQLPSLFAVLPRLPYGVRSMSAEQGNNAPRYVAGAMDGSRAGYFEVNTNSLAAWPRWSLEALFLHEAVPGHHLQISRGQEIGSLPRLRRSRGNFAFVEGWALYAEGLGKELGLYADPYAGFGRLSLDSLRACRLVVDTGLHRFGWSRSQAVDYLTAHAMVDRDFAEAEVDRYLTWPGQATAYKVGEQEILSLRAQAKANLGDRFDIRKFHNAVIDHGPLPLPVLDEVIAAWVATESAAPG